MQSEWKTLTTYVAHFDILGFKEHMDCADASFKMQLLKNKLSGIITDTEARASNFSDRIGLILYADTLVLYSRTVDDSGYPELIRAAKDLITKCIYSRLPVRGAVAYGELSIGYNDRVLVGKAALDSYQYCECQDWIGLLLTPSCTDRLSQLELKPIRHGFFQSEIKTNERCKENFYGVAYGFESHRELILPILLELRDTAPEKSKHKYSNTLNFLHSISQPQNPISF